MSGGMVISGSARRRRHSERVGEHWLRIIPGGKNHGAVEISLFFAAALL
jgi:hypothetical protein